MKHYKGWVLGFVGMALLLTLSTAWAQKRVEGYFRKDGTYVQPHYRSAPDSNPYNNYGFPGNYNPNTGQITQGDPNRYLQRYYESQPLQPYGLGVPQLQPQTATELTSPVQSVPASRGALGAGILWASTLPCMICSFEFIEHLS